MSILTFARKKSISNGIVIRVLDGDWRIPHYVIEFLLKGNYRNQAFHSTEFVC